MSTKNKPQQTLKSREQFIGFFSKIPPKNWQALSFSGHGRKCVFGHLGCRSYEDTRRIENARNLVRLSGLHPVPNTSPMGVNDRKVGPYQQRSPKARVMAWLHDLPVGVTA